MDLLKKLHKLAIDNLFNEKETEEFINLVESGTSIDAAIDIIEEGTSKNKPVKETKEAVMSEEKLYAEKVFKMIEDGVGLITPYGTLYCADRDFLSFELAFFYYFIYDYKMFSQLDSKLRKRILNTFLEKIQTSRPDDFKDAKEVDKSYKARIFSYFKITQEIQKMGEFGDRCANYINTLLTFSEKNNVFTCHSLEQAESELEPQIEPNKYTEELKVLLTVSSSPLLIDGVDPTEREEN
tara:strand:- start:270 stop:986 length:717 start_codon:yes stop_codon:yes gene_type:complete